jgi:hypothetical protein
MPRIRRSFIKKRDEEAAQRTTSRDPCGAKGWIAVLNISNLLWLVSNTILTHYPPKQGILKRWLRMPGQ